jgi:Tfp pilus assembly protein PilX
MAQARKQIAFAENGAALLIVLAFVVLLTGLSVAYLSRTTSDRQVAQGSFHQSKADQLAASAMDNIIGDLRQEIANGSVNLVAPGAMPTVTPAYSPTAAANMLPQRSGNAAAVPNLIRRSVNPDSLSGNPGLPSRASAVNSAPADPANP